MIVLATNDGFAVTDQTNYEEFRIGVGSLTHPEFLEAVGASDAVQPYELPRHLWISIEFLHQELGTATDSDAFAGLNGMLKFASSKGWLNDAGTHVAAHVVVPE